MNRYLKSCVGALAVALTVGASERPNVVLLVTDDQYLFGFERGTDITPNIDRLALEGMLFTRAYTTSACTPSRWNILTGQYCGRCKSDAMLNEVSREGQYRVVWNSSFERVDQLLPRVLQTNGYVTGHVGKNHNGLLGGDAELANIRAARKALAQAGKKTRWDDPEITRLASTYQRALCENFRIAGFDYAGAHVAGNLDKFIIPELGVHNMEWMTKASLDFIDEAKQGDKPFFLYLATTLDHGPHTKSRSLEEDARITPAGLLDAPIRGVQPSRESAIERADKMGLKDRARSVVWLDDAIGAVVDHVAKLGLEKETLFIFMTDNGMKGGKGSVFEGGAKVPLIFRWPEKINAAKSEALVHSIDLAPTILEICGVDAANYRFDGMSLTPLLNGTKKKLRDELYMEWGPTRAIVGPKYKYIATRHPESVITRADYEESVRRFREKTAGLNVNQILKQFPDIEWPYDQYAGYHIKPYKCAGTTLAAVRNYFGTIYDSDQLYDLEADPRERNNLAANPEYREVMERMQKELSAELEHLPGSFGEFKELTPAESAAWAKEYVARHPSD